MSETKKVICPECGDRVAPAGASRREFIRVLGSTAVAAGALGGLGGRLLGQEKEGTPAKPEKPAEELVKELFASLTPEQKQGVLPWDHGAVPGKQAATRLRMFNSAIGGKTIGAAYNKVQIDLNKKILRAITSDEAGWRQISRNGTWDASKAFEGCGATLFGDPASGKYAWVFTGHHLTVRCDGNSEELAGFGGPMYYGHSPNGYSERNCFYYQTKSALEVYDSLSEEQRKIAVVTGSPGEQEPSVRIRPKDQKKPGIAVSTLSADHKKLVENVMRQLLSPYRKEDADEVMELVKLKGGLDAIHLAFYQDAKMNDDKNWHFWRLEGPGMVWNFRVLPHVHTFVNVTGKA